MNIKTETDKQTTNIATNTGTTSNICTTLESSVPTNTVTGSSSIPVNTAAAAVAIPSIPSIPPPTTATIPLNAGGDIANNVSAHTATNIETSVVAMTSTATNNTIDKTGNTTKSVVVLVNSNNNMSHSDAASSSAANCHNDKNGPTNESLDKSLGDLTSAVVMEKPKLRQTRTRKRYTNKQKYDALQALHSGLSKEEVVSLFDVEKRTLNVWIKHKEKIYESQRKRKRYSNQHKYDALKALDNGATKQEVQQQYNVQKRTLNIWIKQKDTIYHLVDNGYYIDRKANCVNHLKRIEDALIQWYDANNKQTGNEKLPVTGHVIAKIAMKAKELLLTKHDNEPFLNQDELKAIRKFTGCDSWGRKFSSKHGWNKTSTSTPNTNNNHAIAI